VSLGSESMSLYDGRGYYAPSQRLVLRRPALGRQAVGSSRGAIRGVWRW
jgi:hypothetical protein